MNMHSNDFKHLFSKNDHNEFFLLVFTNVIKLFANEKEMLNCCPSEQRKTKISINISILQLQLRNRGIKKKKQADK